MSDRVEHVISADSLPAALFAMDEARIALGRSIHDVEDRSGVSYATVHAWRQGIRFPQLANLTAYAETIGFETIMRARGSAFEFNLMNPAAAMSALNNARMECNISTKDLRKISGVSLSSFYSWSRQDRSPTVERLTRLVEALGFQIITRRRQNWPSPYW